MTPPLSFERRAVVSLASLYAFRMLGLFMILPVLSLFGGQYEGSSPFLIGVALGAYGFTQAVLQIPFGMWSDRWARKPVIAIGLLLFTAGSLLAAQADTVYELILGRGLQGCGAIAAAIMALVADLTQDENRTKAMAAIGASIGLSFSLAMVLGPLVSAGFGLEGIFLLTAALAMLGLFILFQWVPTPVHQMHTRSHRDATAVPELLGKTLRNPSLMRLNLGIFSLHFVLMASFIVVPRDLVRVGIERQSHWLVYVPILVLAFAAMIPFIIVAEKRRKIKTVFLAAIALLGVAELAFVFFHVTPYSFLFVLFLFFVAFNMLEATLPSLMSKAAPAGSKGTASGIYSTCQFLGAFAGGVCGGWLMESYGDSAVFGACLVVVLLWLVVSATMPSPRFLTSIQVPVATDQLHDFAERVEDLPGVAEVVVIEEEKAAYMKVDKSQYDPAALEARLRQT